MATLFGWNLTRTRVHCDGALSPRNLARGNSEGHRSISAHSPFVLLPSYAAGLKMTFVQPFLRSSKFL